MSMWDALTDRERGFRLFTPEVLAAVRDCRVLIVGCGGNGAVLEPLVRAGFTNFGLIDGDMVEDTNLNRLPFTRDAVGLAKTEAWAAYLTAINPDVATRGWRKNLTRHDGPWLKSILGGEGWDEAGTAAARAVDLVFLGTTDTAANVVVGRVCAELGVRMIIGPASSGSWVVGTFVHDDGVTLEKLAGFGTEQTALEDIDYEALRPLYAKALNYPGRADKLAPGVGAAVYEGRLAARSCGIFVRMTNAAMAFEAIKNIAAMNHLPLDGTQITRLPQVQIFDPYTGCAYYYDAAARAIGIPDWLTGGVRWEPLRESGGR